MTFLNIITERNKQTENIISIPKHYIDFVEIGKEELLIKNKHDTSFRIVRYFNQLIDVNDEKFKNLIIEIFNEKTDTELTLCYEESIMISIICSSENNFHIYIPEHLAKLK